MNDIKYVILDFGKVLFKPTTGHWFITPKFIELVDINKINIDEFNNNIKLFDDILARKVVTQEEEYNLFYDFYSNLLKSINYSDYSDELAQALAYDITYNDTKYTIYDDTIESLNYLSSKYKLLLLTDNWPCVHNILKKYDIEKYFEKVYVSSEYGYEKKDKIFFDYPINDYNIKNGEGLFIDDNDNLLSIAESKGLEVMLMDRENKNIDTNHRVIHDLDSLCKEKNYR